MPTGEHRALLERRRAELKSAMAASDPRAVVARVARFFLRFPGSSRTENAEGVAAAYAADLSRFPLWAIDAGMMAVITSQGHAAAQFAPSSPVLQDAVRKAMVHASDELSDLGRVLDADVYHEPSAEERERILAGYKELLTSLRWNEPFRMNTRRPDARDAKPTAPDPSRKIDLPPASPALVAVMERQDAERRARGEAAA